MELIRVRDKHLERSELKYGCVCSVCDSAFIFTSSDLTIPRTIHYTAADCSIRCTNCGYSTTLDKCKKLKDELEITAFKLLHSEN